jgi:predicted enzyme related to lactoylglutathione lyase
MTNNDLNRPGSFAWLELGTTDQNAAKKFYSSLLGWTAEDSPMGPEMVYTVFSLNGKKVGGCYTLMEDMRAQGIPPNWTLYVSVKSADETAAKVPGAGGKVCAQPFDVADMGRMAVFQDPKGAAIAVWQAKSHPGMGVKGVNGAFCWADLSTTDQGEAGTFYARLFGWKLDPGEDKSGYLHIKTGEEYIGGILPPQYRDPKTPPHWLAYIQVENCDRSTEKAKSAGGKVYFGPQTMEKVGRWSVVADPQGAGFALFQPGR